ncbi:MAG: NYN domain-containing protein [Gammaproteobacteria bacterium]|nr:NYN domain-containing protein [Gammaproteobacteria bacterium]
MSEQNSARLAILIDADNVSPTIVDGLVAETAKYGVPTVKRIYGDWTTPSLAGWKDALLRFSITPIQQFGYTVGKNATDSAMIIDAMDLLYSGKLDGFCIVSSDSDFTRLASRIRESGLPVYGFGEMKTPKPFVNACDKFTYVEILRDPASDAAASDPRPGDALKGDTALINLLRGAVDDRANDEGWAHLGAVGQYISSQKPDFDSRNYGYAKLSKLIEATSLFETKHESPSGSGGKAVFIRRKRSKTKK